MVLMVLNPGLNESCPSTVDCVLKARSFDVPTSWGSLKLDLVLTVQGVLMATVSACEGDGCQLRVYRCAS